MAYFPLRKKGALITVTDQADYKIVTDGSLNSAQKAALANGTGINIGGTTYTLAQPLPAGAVGFASEQGAAQYLLEQNPNLGSAKWFDKYSGPLWERLVAGIAAVGALGIGDGGEDPATGEEDGKPTDGSSEDDSKPDDGKDTDSKDDSTGKAVATAAGALTVAGFLGALTNINVWLRLAKVVGGGAILIIGLAKLTGADKQVGGIVKKGVEVAPFL